MHIIRQHEGTSRWISFINISIKRQPLLAPHLHGTRLSSSAAHSGKGLSGDPTKHPRSGTQHRDGPKQRPEPGPDPGPEPDREEEETWGPQGGHFSEEKEGEELTWENRCFLRRNAVGYNIF